MVTLTFVLTPACQNHSFENFPLEQKYLTWSDKELLPEMKDPSMPTKEMFGHKGQAGNGRGWQSMFNEGKRHVSGGDMSAYKCRGDMSEREVAYGVWHICGGLFLVLTCLMARGWQLWGGGKPKVPSSLKHGPKLSCTFSSKDCQIINPLHVVTNVMIFVALQSLSAEKRGFNFVWVWLHWLWSGPCTTRKVINI